MSAIINAGTVVINIYRIWSKILTPTVDDAMIVVSDSIDSLSPKYAPEIIAPAIHPSENP